MWMYGCRARRISMDLDWIKITHPTNEKWKKKKQKLYKEETWKFYIIFFVYVKLSNLYQKKKNKNEKSNERRNHVKYDQVDFILIHILYIYVCAKYWKDEKKIVEFINIYLTPAWIESNMIKKKKNLHTRDMKTRFSGCARSRPKKFVNMVLVINLRIQLPCIHSFYVYMGANHISDYCNYLTSRFLRLYSSSHFCGFIFHK